MDSGSHRVRPDPNDSHITVGVDGHGWGVLVAKRRCVHAEFTQRLAADGINVAGAVRAEQPDKDIVAYYLTSSILTGRPSSAASKAASKTRWVW